MTTLAVRCINFFCRGLGEDRWVEMNQKLYDAEECRLSFEESE